MDIMKDNVLMDNKNGRLIQFIIFVRIIEMVKRLIEMLKSKVYNCECLIGIIGKVYKYEILLRFRELIIKNFQNKIKNVNFFFIF